MIEPTADKAPITCIINVRNGEKYIKQAIDSVVAQTIPVHLVVVDNQSSDQTFSIVSAYPDVVLVKTPEPMTLGAARNYSLAYIKTEYVSWLDADDLWEANFCEASLQAFHHSPQAVLVSSSTILIDENNQRLPEKKQRLMVKDGSPNGFTEGDTLEKLFLKFRSEASWQSYVFKSDIIRKVEGFNSRLKFAVDLDLIAKLLLHGKSVHIQQNLSLCRIHSQQVTVTMDPYLRYGECYHILTEIVEKAGLRHQVNRKSLWSIIKFKISLAFFLERRSLVNGLKASWYVLNPVVALWLLRRAFSYGRY